MLEVLEELPPLFLIRHAQDEKQKNRYDINRSLAKTGMEQAVVVGDYLEQVQELGAKTVILGADLRRTTQTAQIISGVLNPENQRGKLFISKALTEFGELKYHKMDQIIEETAEPFGDFRGFFVKELLRLNPGYKINPKEPIVVVTQRPVIARVMGIHIEESSYACVYQFPAPGGVPRNLVESLIH